MTKMNTALSGVILGLLISANSLASDKDKVQQITISCPSPDKLTQLLKAKMQDEKGEPSITQVEIDGRPWILPPKEELAEGPTLTKIVDMYALESSVKCGYQNADGSLTKGNWTTQAELPMPGGIDIKSCKYNGEGEEVKVQDTGVQRIFTGALRAASITCNAHSVFDK